MARDHFGIKPLYYYQDDDRIITASEIKAILEHPEVTAEPDFDAICDYITYQYVLNSSTLFKNIHKLPPGHLRVIDLSNGSTNTSKYWDPSFKVDTFHTEEYFIHTLRQLLEDTINIQLRSDVPLGTYLSGGIDSSLVTLMASSRYNGKIKSFNGAFKEGPQFDESNFARKVTDACGAELHQIYPSEDDFVRIIAETDLSHGRTGCRAGSFPPVYGV